MRKLYVLLIGFLVGCTDIINVQPENDTTFTNYFQTLDHAEALLVNLELSVRNMMCTSQEANPQVIAGEIADSTSAAYMSDPRELSATSYTQAKWVNFYATINAADLILDNLSRFPLSEEELKPYELQAYFAKGLCYFLLAQRWGEVPITKGTTYFGKIAKSSVHDVLEEATKYALKALELPVYADLKDNYGKARATKQYGSKGAAAALLAHLYAWRASIENVSEYWGEAEKYCTMIIDNQVGFYDLAANPEELCDLGFAGNHKESIWEVYRSVEDNAVSTSLSVAYFSEIFVGIPTYIDLYSGADKIYNIMIFKSRVKKMFDPEDRRRDAYFWGLDADEFYLRRGTEMNECVLSYGPNDEIIATYSIKDRKEAYVNKFRNPAWSYNAWNESYSYAGMEICKVYWRLADIILLRAECRARQNNPAAIDDLNRIRKRAYGNRAHDYTATEGDLRLAIFREREKELLFEDHRYYDVRRNGDDYVRRELPEAFGKLTDDDIKNGALYLDVDPTAFQDNDLMRHNVYWNKFLQ